MLKERKELNMVGIVIISHGDFAKGIFQSGSMIFGKQENVIPVVLETDDSPNVFERKLEAAIGCLENQQEVLILADLFGGTPFNQASILVKEHEQSWALVTGLSLPMLIEAYGCRLRMDKAQQIAVQINSLAKDGIKVLPDHLISSKEKKNSISKKSTIVKGLMEFSLVRIDSRLLHGQVATAWTKAIIPSRIIIVSDEVAKDPLRKSLIVQAAPLGVKVNVVPIAKMIEVAKDDRFGNTKAMLLFENPQDALRAIEGGVPIRELNIGSMAHAEGKVAVNKVLSLDMEDVTTYDKLVRLGIKFDVRKVPSDTKADFMPLLKKAKAELTDSKKVEVN